MPTEILSQTPNIDVSDFTKAFFHCAPKPGMQPMIPAVGHPRIIFQQPWLRWDIAAHGAETMNSYFHVNLQD